MIQAVKSVKAPVLLPDVCFPASFGKSVSDDQVPRRYSGCLRSHAETGPSGASLDGVLGRSLDSPATRIGGQARDACARRHGTTPDRVLGGF